MKRSLWILLGVLVALTVAGAAFGFSQASRQSSELQNLETAPAIRGDLRVKVDATGLLRSDQSAQLTWRASGRVEQVLVKSGQAVSAGQVLASLEQASLSQSVILAQAEWINAQRALDDLLQSKQAQAQAQKAVEQAQQALEDAQNPDVARAQTLEAIANAQKELIVAEGVLAVVTSSASEDAIENVRTSMLLAKDVLDRTQSSVDRIRRRLAIPESQYFFFESRKFYRKILDSLEMKLVRDQRAYEDAANRYNALLQPPNPTDVAQAEAAVAKAKANLIQSQRDWEQIESGPSTADVAVRQAELADAERAWERVKTGPNDADLAAAQARLDAAQATLESVRITAPFDGVITSVVQKPGDQVAPGTQAFRLDDFSALIVDLMVTEIDINRIQVGQAAELNFDAVPGKQYLGEVLEVLAVGTNVEGVVSFEVRVKLVDPDSLVKPGMTVSATIIVGEVVDTLLVPSRAVRYQQGEPVVILRQGDELKTVPVELGVTSDTYTQVLDGALTPGDLVVLNPPD